MNEATRIACNQCGSAGITIRERGESNQAHQVVNGKGDGTGGPGARLWGRGPEGPPRGGPSGGCMEAGAGTPRISKLRGGRRE